MATACVVHVRIRPHEAYCGPHERLGVLSECAFAVRSMEEVGTHDADHEPVEAGEGVRLKFIPIKESCGLLPFP